MSKIYLPNGDVIIMEEGWAQSNSEGSLTYRKQDTAKTFLGTIHQSGIVHLSDRCKHTLQRYDGDIIERALQHILETGVNNFTYSKRQKLKQLKKLLHQLDARK